jgi:hypothetical protein
MFEVLTGAGLATAAGLNAYIPLLAIGLLSRFTDLVNLPPAWAWLENGWVQIILGVLLIIEVIADKIPAVDSINDWIQTIVRPAAGGIVFGSGTAAQTATVTDPASFFTSNAWVPIVIGILLALTVHVGKTVVRPAANVATAGIAAPVLSTIEDVFSAVMSFVALLLPILVIVGLAGLVAGAIGLGRRMRRRRAEAPPIPPVPPLPRADSTAG